MNRSLLVLAAMCLLLAASVMNAQTARVIPRPPALPAGVQPNPQRVSSRHPARSGALLLFETSWFSGGFLEMRDAAPPIMAKLAQPR